MYLLFTDTHLDDQATNEYRWRVFDEIEKVKQRYPVSHVFNLGDFVDRKDRFTGAFINRLIEQLHRVAPITILRGNHDTTLNPPNYFDFLSEEFLKHRVHYISQPTAFGDRLLLLPFTPRPREDWKGIAFRSYTAAFMHATVPGAMIENGRTLENPSFPMLPGDLKVYSGDVHVPQTVRNVTYVGCPHPIKFGDNFPCRMLLLDEESYAIVEEVKLKPQRKLMLDIRSVEDLAESVNFRPGDQVKLRFHCKASEVEQFGRMEAALAAWAATNHVTLAGTEVVVTSSYNRDVDTNLEPAAILRQFAAQEGLSDDLLQAGLALLDEVMVG